MHFTGAGLNQISGNTLYGTHTIDGTLNWTGGDLGSPGTTTIGSGSTFNISVGTANLPSGRTITNNGMITHTGGNIRGGGDAGSIINNNALFLESGPADNDVDSAYGGIGLVLNNNASGTYRKNTAINTYMYAPFNNYGLVDTQAGNLVLVAGTGNDGSTINAGANGTN